MPVRSTIDRSPASERNTSISTTVEPTSTAGLSIAALSTKCGAPFEQLQTPTIIANQASSSCHPSGSHACRPRGDWRRKPANLHQRSGTNNRLPDFIAPDSRRGSQFRPREHSRPQKRYPVTIVFSRQIFSSDSYSGRSPVLLLVLENRRWLIGDRPTGRNGWLPIRSTIDRSPASERNTSISTKAESTSTSTALLSTAALSTSTNQTNGIPSHCPTRTQGVARYSYSYLSIDNGRSVIGRLAATVGCPFVRQSIESQQVNERLLYYDS